MQEAAAEQTQTKMDPELKAKWVKALRSGEYKQANSALKAKLDDNMGFCCLGVLADICGAKWVPQNEDDDEGEAWEFAPVIDGVRVDLNGMGGFLSDDFATKCGLGRYNETLDEVSIQARLAKLNDGNDYNTSFQPQSFFQIADYIEKNL